MQNKFYWAISVNVFSCLSFKLEFLFNLNNQILFLLCACACMVSCFSHVWLSEILGTVAHQTLLFTGFSRQEYWSSLWCSTQGYLPDPGTEPVSPAAPVLKADSLPLSHWGSPLHALTFIFSKNSSFSIVSCYSSCH